MRAILFVGPFPPPIHGASKITECVYRLVEQAGDELAIELHRVSTAGPTLNRTIGYHIQRVRAHAAAVLRAVTLRAKGPLTVYVGGAGGAGLWYQLLVVVAAKLVVARVVFHHHNYSYISDRRVASMQGLSRVLGKSDYHVFLTPGMRDLFLEKYSTTAQAVVVSNAAFIDSSRPRSAGPRGGPLRLVHLSNLSRDKGSDVVVQAFTQLKNEGRDVELVLAGPCSDRTVTSEIETAQQAFRDSFEYVGPVDSVGAADILSRADVFVFPTTYANEAQPLVVLEALAQGVPTIATQRGAIVEMLPLEWLMQAASSTETAERVVQLLDDDWSTLSHRAVSEFERSRGDDLDTLLQVLSSSN